VTDATPPRCGPLPPEVLASTANVVAGTPESELLERLDDALAALPSPERAAVVTALGYGEDVADVAEDLRLPAHDAEVLIRSALQLLRGALADAEPGDGQHFARLATRRARRPD
jgi:DNA-directed RNA polymerase specialized sigma24 family protein